MNGNYRLVGFGDFDPGAVLSGAIDQARANTGAAAVLGAGILLGVMYVVFRSPARRSTKIWR